MMLYYALIAMLLIISTIVGVIFAKKDLKKTKKNKAKLRGLDNKDIPCGDAFLSLELCNPWEE